MLVQGLPIVAGITSALVQPVGPLYIVSQIVITISVEPDDYDIVWVGSVWDYPESIASKSPTARVGEIIRSTVECTVVIYLEYA